MFRGMASMSQLTITPAPILWSAQKTQHARRQDATSTVTFPLTTVFDRPSNCSDFILKWSDGGPQWNDLGSTSGVSTVFKWGASSCCTTSSPSPTIHTPSANRFSDPNQFYVSDYYVLYSPGGCPSGMSIAVSTVFPDPPVTKALCCNS